MAAASTPRKTGRPAQRRRTRTAILDATERLLRDGTRPTLDEIAASAEVSRRTIYMHFPTLDQLILDASMGALAGREIRAEFAPESDATERVEMIVDTLWGHGRDWLPLGRRMVALTAATPSRAGPTRGHRRVDWIERAVEPLRERLTDEQYDRLVSSLSIVLGWEAMIVLEDIRGHAPEREREIAAWTARSLVRAILDEAGAL
ncbi:TetR/AcrR family transcriptional regulator [Arthrobacter sp. ISL-85]|uniref:TetR/AcrR family transcriptional regulator n=1 Tax=Arthrobacter sp. ISL-85 TaxID=2819115 RepID=UPI001BEA226A|nr:TetR/AcrR family transcriptional regulator [Arthrobacter sp. ISL-85]MBT2568549.1 TetR/AcrR family transcriptional regulator [Arthrobacter sp. ISL-85]